MRYVVSLFIVLASFSQTDAQCQTGQCQNGGMSAGRMSPVQRPGNFNPPPQPSVTQNPVYNNPNQGYPAPVIVKGQDGKNGRDGKDVDPQLLLDIQKQLVAIDNRLQNREDQISQINSQLVSLQKSIDASGQNQANLETKVVAMDQKLVQISQTMSGQLRVRFKYDPKTNSVAPVSLSSN